MPSTASTIIYDDNASLYLGNALAKLWVERGGLEGLPLSNVWGCASVHAIWPGAEEAFILDIYDCIRGEDIRSRKFLRTEAFGSLSLRDISTRVTVYGGNHIYTRQDFWHFLRLRVHCLQSST